MESLGTKKPLNIVTALDTLSSSLTELNSIQDALANMGDPVRREVDAVAQRVGQLKRRIADFITPDDSATV